MASRSLEQGKEQLVGRDLKGCSFVLYCTDSGVDIQVWRRERRTSLQCLHASTELGDRRQQGKGQEGCGAGSWCGKNPDKPVNPSGSEAARALGEA